MADREEFLQLRQRQGLLRTLRPAAFHERGKIRIKNKEYFDFSSNDYLGLSGHPRLKEAAKEATDKFGTSSSASRLLSGSLELHQKLEEEVAVFKGKEASLVFNSGYQANTGIVSALFGREDVIFSDRLNHASILDGILLSGAHIFRFQHNDTGHLAALLARERKKFKRCLIITESLFGMDGDKAPLADLISLKEKYDGELFVDEAHATGVFGKKGSGLVEDFALTERIDFIMGTFSKALGSFGAYLATSKKNVEYLVNTCRSFIYSTALPPAVIAANLASLNVVREEPYRRQELLLQAEFFRGHLQEKGFSVKGESQIIPWVIGDSHKTKELAESLQQKGYWVLPIRPPTVPKGQARLRFSLSYNHTREILEELIKLILESRI